MNTTQLATPERLALPWRSATARWLAAVLLAAGLAVPAFANAQQLDPAELAARVGIDQHLGRRLPADLPFVDEQGARIVLDDVLGDRPVILGLVYYECPMLCGVAMRGLIDNLRVLSFDLGREYDVVTVSIDPGETAEIAAAKKVDYLRRYSREGEHVAAGWRTLTGPQASIEALAETVGFRYVYDPATDEYAHGAAVMIITPDGVISRYFYGVEYPARDLRLAIVEASEEAIGTIADQVMLLCYRYDPVTGRYGFAIWTALRATGALTVLALLAFIGTSLLRERRRERDAAPEMSS